MVGHERSLIVLKVIFWTRTTCGSVHTMEDDLTELMKMKEGETMEICGRLYKIKDGKFVKPADEKGL